MMNAERCKGVNVKMMYDENAFRKAYDEIVEKLQPSGIEEVDQDGDEDKEEIAAIANECVERPPGDKSGIPMFPRTAEAGCRSLYQNYEPVSYTHLTLPTTPYV